MRPRATPHRCDGHVVARSALAAPAGASARAAPSTKSPNTARRCRTAIPPSSGRRAARICGRRRAARRTCRSRSATSGAAPGVVKGAYARAAAVLRRRRPGDGPRDAARLLHGHAAGLLRGRREEGPVRRGQRAQVRHRSAGRLHHVGIARRGDERRARDTRRSRRRTGSARRSSISVAERTTSPARPATARTASGSACRTCRTWRAPTARRRPIRRGPRIACRRASCARSSGGCTTASGSSVSPSSVHLGRVDRADDVPCAQRQRRTVQRPGHQALTGAPAMTTTSLSCSRVRRARRGRHRSPAARPRRPTPRSPRRRRRC